MCQAAWQIDKGCEQMLIFLGRAPCPVDPAPSGSSFRTLHQRALEYGVRCELAAVKPGSVCRTREDQAHPWLCIHAVQVTKRHADTFQGCVGQRGILIQRVLGSVHGLVHKPREDLVWVQCSWIAMSLLSWVKPTSM